MPTWKRMILSNGKKCFLSNSPIFLKKGSTVRNRSGRLFFSSCRIFKHLVSIFLRIKYV
ncbi:UNVERIFIED_CONTAM: hypothetical protein GTU68_009349 [Idotea baltica]|nr:hypothetical protein [Idotea baltica]